MNQPKESCCSSFTCVITVKNHLDSCWQNWFEDVSIKSLSEDIVLLSGFMPDQPALFGLLNRIRDLNLGLISIEIKRNDDDCVT